MSLHVRKHSASRKKTELAGTVGHNETFLFLKMPAAPALEVGTPLFV